MRGRDVELELADQPAQSGHLTLGDFQDQTRERGGVDDRMLERALQAAPDKPGVERVVAVLDEHSPVRKSEEGPPGVLEDRRPDEHRAIDVVPLAGIRVDRCPAVDERVEERQGAVKSEPLRAELEDEKRRVAGGFDVEGDELRLVQGSQRADLRRVDRYLLPRNGLDRAPRLQEQRLWGHRLKLNALRANSISSRLTARTRSEATAYTTIPTRMGIAMATPPRLRNG